MVIRLPNGQKNAPLKYDTFSELQFASEITCDSAWVLLATIPPSSYVVRWWR